MKRKYIDAEKLKAEIERRIDILTHVYSEQVERKDEEMCTYYHGKIVALEELRSFIEWLEKEQYGAPKIKGWVARYANGDLEVGKEKPRYYEYEGKTYITNPCQTIHLDESWFPELHWLDNPIEVELTIRKV